MKISIIKFQLILFLILGINTSAVFAQSTNSEFKNTVKFNVSNMLLYDNSYQFSYERIVKQNQSINVFAGYQRFPLISVDLGANTNFKQKSDRQGFSLGAEYRFYLGSVNKYSAPRGIYLAPFVSYFQFGSNRDLTYTDSSTQVTTEATLSSKLSLVNVGGELGYQFVFWDRFVVDCVLFGPSLTRYNYNIQLGGDLTGLDQNEVYQKIVDAMKNKFPEIGNITSGEGITKKGVQSITAVGFRYNISIGYRF
jgi:hypothetical protein